MEKLNRAQKCSILGPQNLGSGGARAPGPPPGSAPEYLQEVEVQCKETVLSKSNRFKASAKMPILSQGCHFK